MDFALAALTNPVGLFLDALQRLVDGQQLFTLAVIEDEVYFTVSLVTGQIVGIPTFIFLALSLFFYAAVHFSKQLLLCFLQHFSSLLQEISSLFLFFFWVGFSSHGVFHQSGRNLKRQ